MIIQRFHESFRTFFSFYVGHRIQSYFLGTPNEKQIQNLTGSLMKEPLCIDGRLPPGWYRKIIERKCGKTAGRNDYYICSPEHKRFRSRNEVKKYFDENCECILKVHQFDFSVSGKKLV